MNELKILDVGFSTDKKGVKLLMKNVEILLNSDNMKSNLKKIPPNIEKLYELAQENIKDIKLLDKIIKDICRKACVYYLASYKTGVFTEVAAEKLKAYKMISFWKMEDGSIIRAKKGRRPANVLATFKKPASEVE